MHKEVRTAHASRFKRATFGLFIILLAGIICFVLSHIRPTTSGSLKLLGFGSNQNGFFVMVQFSNSGPATISYLGFDTNQPFYGTELKSLSRPEPEYPIPIALYPNPTPPYTDAGRWYELKARQSVDFQVPWGSGSGLGPDPPDFELILDYFAPGRLDLFHKNTQYPRTAHSELVKSNSLAKAN